MPPKYTVPSVSLVIIYMLLTATLRLEFAKEKRPTYFHLNSIQ